MKSLLLLACVAGCDPGWTVRGRVVDPAQRAIANAFVIHRCPGTDAIITARTGADGEFGFGQIGSIDKRCSVEVRADGYRVAALALRDQPVTGSFDTSVRVALTLIPLEVAP